MSLARRIALSRTSAVGTALATVFAQGPADDRPTIAGHARRHVSAASIHRVTIVQVPDALAFYTAAIALRLRDDIAGAAELLSGADFATAAADDAVGVIGTGIIGSDPLVASVQPCLRIQRSAAYAHVFISAARLACLATVKEGGPARLVTFRRAPADKRALARFIGCPTEPRPTIAKHPGLDGITGL